MTVLSPSTVPTAGRVELTERRTLLEEQWRVQRAAIVDLSSDALAPSDDADDDGSWVSEQHVTSQLLAAARQQLAETEAALERLDDGTYGVCADCSKPISAERLEILPAARYCVTCQATRSRRG